MTDLSDKTKDELHEIASAMDIEGRSSMSKDELLAAIEAKADEPATSNLVTPVIPDPPADPRPVEEEGGTADQSSAGGTITGTTVPAGTTPTPTSAPITGGTAL